MNVFKNINDAKYFIGKLTDTAKSVKTDKQKLFYVNMINAFINLVNTAESLVNKTESINIIDSLILARIYDSLNIQEYKSYNYAKNIFVVEQINDRISFLGTIETDAIVQANYVLKSEGINRIGLPINVFNGSDKVKYISKEQSNKLIECFYSQKENLIDIKSIVENINIDISNSSVLNRKKVIDFLKAKETDLLLKNNQTELLESKEFDLLIDDLLNQFKNFI